MIIYDLLKSYYLNCYYNISTQNNKKANALSIDFFSLTFIFAIRSR